MIFFHGKKCIYAISGSSFKIENIAKNVYEKKIVVTTEFIEEQEIIIPAIGFFY